MSGETDAKHKTIFLVEDNRADIRLVEEALKNSSIPHQGLTVRDGMNAMAFLRRDTVQKDDESSGRLFRRVKSKEEIVRHE